MKTSRLIAACKRLLFITVLFALSAWLASCFRTAGVPLPDGSCEYSVHTAADGTIVLLGYPYPRADTASAQPLSLPSAPPYAYLYEEAHGTYRPTPVRTAVLQMPLGTLSLPYAETAEGPLYFAARADADSKQILCLQGTFCGMAVLLWDNTLYLADEAGYTVIDDNAGALFDLHPSGNALLYADANGILCEYTHSGGKRTLAVDLKTDTAWYVRGTTEPCTRVFRAYSEGDLARQWYCLDGDIRTQANKIPSDSGWAAHYVRGTRYVLYGNSHTAYLSDMCTDAPLDIDLGGLYFFGRGSDLASLPLSPDGRYVYFYDTDFIYRIALSDGALTLTYNDAHVYEEQCELTAIIPVTPSTVLLSQASNEFTEFDPTITPAIFEEDIPQDPHEHDKIDVDTHPTSTDSND